MAKRLLLKSSGLDTSFLEHTSSLATPTVSLLSWHPCPLKEQPFCRLLVPCLLKTPWLPQPKGGFPDGASGEEPACYGKRKMRVPTARLRKNPTQRRKWQPTASLLAREITDRAWQASLWGHKVGHSQAFKQAHTPGSLGWSLGSPSAAGDHGPAARLPSPPPRLLPTLASRAQATCTLKTGLRTSPVCALSPPTVFEISAKPPFPKATSH